MAGTYRGKIWIPGDRFEADLAAGHRIASILDRKEARRFSQIDAAGMRSLRAVVDAASRAMEVGEEPRHAKDGRFVSDVSINRQRADVKDLEGTYRKSTFQMLSREELAELRELVYVLQEHLEAEGA